MIVFISGSINSGKTTTGKALSKKLNAKFIDIDDLNDRIPNFDLSKDISKGIDIAINEINNLTNEGYLVVVSYVIRKKDFDQLNKGLIDRNTLFITLAPTLEIAQSKRGDRDLSEWEIKRIKYHYEIGIANPSFGNIIDNSDLSIDETVDVIAKLVK